MKGAKMKLLILSAVFLVSFAFANNAYENDRVVVPSSADITGTIGPIWDGPLAELFNTGPWFNSAGTGFGGADESILEWSPGTYGWGCQEGYDNIVADDFVVPSGETWSITGITVGGYQTGSSTTPTIDALYLACYDDNPPTGTLVYGDLTTNVFSSAVWSGIYRVNVSGSGTASNRPIMAVTANPATPWVLGEGTYWIAYQLDGSLSSGPWAPPVVIMGTGDTGNGIQSTDNGVSYAPVTNGSANYPQGFLIILEGDLVSLQRSTWGSIKTVF